MRVYPRVIHASLLKNGIERRLIGNIRGTDDIANSTVLSKIWDNPGNEETEAQFQADLRAASGIGKRTRGAGKVVCIILSRNSSPCQSYALEARSQGWPTTVARTPRVNRRRECRICGRKSRTSHPTHDRGHSHRATRRISV